MRKKYAKVCVIEKKAVLLHPLSRNKRSKRENFEEIIEVFSENREVAQLVAHHVRDVGVGRSSRLFSTKRDTRLDVPFLFGNTSR